jgi:tRNA pseudouridine55 synthase
MDGLLLVDKPAGPTSHDVVARARRALRETRIGHTGTLDPAASGLLPIVVGRATRLARFLTGADKTYEATIRLGVSTDTYDADGVPAAPSARPLPDREAIERALEAFRGTFDQRPPPFSAKKIAGRRSYALAREARRAGGEAAPGPAPVAVTASHIEIVDCDGDRLAVRITCSAGFYVRSLAHDLGAALGVGGHVVRLRRTRSGAFSVADAMALEALEADPGQAAAALVPMSRMLPGLPAVVLTADGLRHAAHGRDLAPGDVAGPWRSGEVRLLDAGGALVGIGVAPEGSALLHPSVVLM